MSSQYEPATVSLPEIGDLMSYRGVYALCTVTGKGGRRLLKATRYATVLIGGPSPLWGVWRIDGRFDRFFGFRSEIEEAFPRLVWKRKMATWKAVDLTDKSIATRRAELETVYGKSIPEPV